MRRWIALLLVLALLPIPAAFAREASVPRPITEAEYAAVDLLWDKLETVTQKATRQVPLDAMVAAIEADPLYVEGSLQWQGTEHFTFETTVGVACAWSSRIEELARSVVPYTGEETPEYETISYGIPGATGAKDVYVFQPYYGIDSSFTTQYQTEGQAIAEATGGTYHLFTKTAATIDAIADAMGKGAVVIFDSHGDTDYAGANEDYTSGATTSYLLLQTGTGLTDEDYAIDNGTRHAYYYGSFQGMRYYAVDGTCIANHMDRPAPGNLLWMAICLSMATDGLYAPLQEQGVAVAYGYSQSVTFGGDYCWEGCFWDEMRKGVAVKDAIATMKEKYGCWDCSPQIYAANGWARDRYYCGNLAQAQKNRAAFPIVVSAEDLYPGHGNVDNLQTVNSTWNLYSSPLPVIYYLTSESNDENLGTVTQQDNVVIASPKENYYACGWTLTPENSAKVLREGNVFTVSEPTKDCCLTIEFREKEEAVIHFSVPEGCSKDSLTAYTGDTVMLTAPEGAPLGNAYSYEFLGWAMEPLADTAEVPFYLTDTYMPLSAETTLYALYTYTLDETVYYTTELSVRDCPSEDFVDIPEGIWYHEAVDYVLAKGLMKGVSADSFDPDGQLTRAMLATILYRISGAPESGAHPFTDVAEGLWYSEAIAWAYENGVVNGIDGVTFAPNAPVTRQQAAAMLYRYACLVESDVTAQGDLSQFRDADRIAEYAKQPLSWAVGAGIINGVGNERLDPEGTATRAQIAKIIYQWLEFSQVGG